MSAEYGHGLNSGQVVVQLKAVPEAYSYELRYAPLGKRRYAWDLDDDAARNREIADHS